MKYRYLMICCLLASCFFLNACATVLTVAGLPLEEVTLGDERNNGRLITSNYQLIEGTKEFTLLEKPYCMETAKEKIIFKKRLRGVIPAIFEIPLYGFGLLDLVIARQYSVNTVREEEGQVVETGSIIECGDYRPVVNAELVIQCPETGRMTSVSTGSAGEITASKLFAGFLQNSQVNIFVREEHCFAYVSSLSSSVN